MKRRILKLSTLFCLLLPVITGCWDMREMEHMFYAHTIGIDYKNNQYEVYVQFLDFSTLGKTEGGAAAGGGTGAWVGKGVGKSFYAAIHNLYSTTQRRIFWGHLNAIVLTENLLKNDYLDVLDILTRYHEMRYTPWVFATTEPLEKILAISPVLERSPVYSQLSDPEDVYRQSTQIRTLRLHRFLSIIYEPAETPFIPDLVIAEKKWKDEKRNYNALETNGVFVLRDKTLAGWLSKSDFSGFLWLDRKTARAPMVIYSGGEMAASLTLEESKPEIIPKVRGDRVFFDIKVSMKGNIVGLGENVSESFISGEAEKTIKKEIRQTFQKGLKIKADPLSLLDALYHKHPAEWSRVVALNKFPLGSDSIESLDVKVRITSAGKTTKALSKTIAR